MVLGALIRKFINGKFPKSVVWLAISTVLLVLIPLSSCTIVNPEPFTMAGGDEQLLVLLRNDKDGNYQVRLRGSPTN